MSTKRLRRDIPGGRLVVPCNDGVHDYEEVRSCYDDPVPLPEYDENPDDEDLSDVYVPPPDYDEKLEKCIKRWEKRSREYHLKRTKNTKRKKK